MRKNDTYAIEDRAKGFWFYDAGNLQVEHSETRQPICDVSTAWDLGERDDMISSHEVHGNGQLLALAPAMHEALEFIRSNLSKMHVDENIRQRCLDKIKEVLG